jgi:hypothetical protein
MSDFSARAVRAELRTGMSIHNSKEHISTTKKRIQAWEKR